MFSPKREHGRYQIACYDPFILGGIIMKFRLTLLVALGTLATTIASAQTPNLNNRINGTVKSVAADHIVVTTAKGDVDLAITAQTRYGLRNASNANDIKPGTYLGTSNQNGSAPDTGTATEVHVMEKGPNIQFPMNDTGLTMTNGRVTSVKRTDKGQEMEIDYGKDTKRRVTVTGDTSVTTQTDATVADVKPGLHVMAILSADSKSTTYVTIEPAAKK